MSNWYAPFDDVAAHDVDFGELPIDWHSDPEDLSNVQEFDAIDSGPFFMWFTAHMQTSVFETTYDRSDRNLWEFGYVFWDSIDTRVVDVSQSCEDARNNRPYFRRPEFEWTTGEVSRSIQQRGHIWLAGGAGYWPRYGFDFSRIDGLSEEKQQELIDRWQRDEEMRNSLKMIESNPGEDE
ncbi:hypothetical protein G7Z17_g9059 [Cylindrodendrum hubeiense]|uniref:Uncharacterized protein n=1 Tax=Cylindrodendrum hubeiense TaxID=595255 RepID=A0A9P5H9X7_9HYPO|nr:hypothetical protein G7Z17_g9059 [Cylindrodendrum hubeiense]